MTTDIVLGAIAIAAVIGGVSSGGVRKLAGWLGAFGALAGVSALLPTLLRSSARPAPGRFLAGTALLLVAGWVGSAIGSAIGSRFRPRRSSKSLTRVDRFVGGVLGFASVVVLSWMVLPAMAKVPGWPQRAVASSSVAKEVEQRLGPPPRFMDGLWRFLGVNSLDDLIAGFGAPSDDIKIPNESPLPPSLVGTLQPSVVRISGPACDNEKSGSGFVVNNGLVVTNAHVVAGVSKITVTSDEDDYSAVIVGFDAHVDLAVLRVAGLKAKPLPMAVPEDGEVGAVLGYPGGGALSVQPYRLDSTIIANTADIYGGGPVRRSVTIIGSNVRAGDSGGPLVTAGGEVHGVVFAVASDHPGVAYAIGAAEIIETLSKVSDTALDSGACT